MGFRRHSEQYDKTANALDRSRTKEQREDEHVKFRSFIYEKFAIRSIYCRMRIKNVETTQDDLKGQTFAPFATISPSIMVVKGFYGNWKFQMSRYFSIWKKNDPENARSISDHVKEEYECILEEFGRLRTQGLKPAGMSYCTRRTKTMVPLPTIICIQYSVRSL